MAFLYVPNGKNMADWTPKAEGHELRPARHPRTAASRSRTIVLVLTGLTADKARAHGDGGGDHARALSAFLTGCQPRKTDGTDIRAGISVDQVAAGRIGDQTRLPSLEIGCEHGGDGRQLRLGLQLRLLLDDVLAVGDAAVAQGGQPEAGLRAPVRHRPDAEPARRDAQRKSILDFVREDAGDLRTAARRDRPAQARRVFHRDPRHRTAHRAGREAAAGEGAATGASRRASRRSYQEHIRS